MRRVGADDRRAELLAIVHRHFDLPGVSDDVVVGEDVALFIDDEAGALPFLGHESVEEVESDSLAK